MMDVSLASMMLAGVPLAGALLCLAFWSKPEQVRVCAIATSVIGMGAAAGFIGFLASASDGPLFVVLLPLAATASILTQPVHHRHRSSWVLTLVFLSLGLGVITQPGLSGSIFITLIVGLNAVLLYRYHSPLWPMSWWGIGTYGFGVAMALVATSAQGSLAAIASLLVSAVLLPLAPFHGGYLAALTRLPGNLPAFLAVLLPVAGTHGLAFSIANRPEYLTETITIFAVGGALYGAMKALVQSRVRLRLAYGSVSFFSILWWFTASARGTEASASVFIGAVALVTSGLLLAWQIVRTRYGDDVDPHGISGLAAAMPRYAVLFSLLALAAIGLPPFGVFAGFIGMLLSPSLSFSIALLMILTVWLTASWYILDMVQRLLFGPRRADMRYGDVNESELASLLLVLVALLVLGVLPAHVFTEGMTITAAEMRWVGWMN